MLLAAHISTAFAQDNSGRPSHNRHPHPPTSRPPEITDGMRLGISPPPFEASQPVQSPFEVAGRSQPQPMQPAQSPAPQVKPVQQPQPVSQPQPIKVAKTVVEDIPEVQVAPTPLPEAPNTPETMPGYIVFVAGLLLLFRKSNAR